MVLMEGREKKTAEEPQKMELMMQERFTKFLIYP